MPLPRALPLKGETHGLPTRPPQYRQRRVTNREPPQNSPEDHQEHPKVSVYLNFVNLGDLWGPVALEDNGNFHINSVEFCTVF